jgi:hypothetical protein
VKKDLTSAVTKTAPKNVLISVAKRAQRKEDLTNVATTTGPKSVHTNVARKVQKRKDLTNAETTTGPKNVLISVARKVNGPGPHRVAEVPPAGKNATPGSRTSTPKDAEAPVALASAMPPTVPI